MIPRAAITEWRNQAPWPGNDQIEHDLVLSRALCELYQNHTIQKQLAFRGGTAIHKLFISPSARFSEDLDFVQIQAGPIGELIKEIRSCLDYWLGEPSWKQNQGRFTLNYLFKTEFEPIVKRKLKIEINTREHFHVQPYIHKEFQVNSLWFKASATIITYSLEELMGTKLRALYQRKKGRDLFDFWCVLQQYPNIDIKALIQAYISYIQFEGTVISRAEFEKNLDQKKQDRSFNEDIFPLLAQSVSQIYTVNDAFNLIHNKIITQLPGVAWKSSANSRPTLPE